MLSRCFLDFSVDVGAFVIGLSKISSFFSWSFYLRLVSPPSLSWLLVVSPWHYIIAFVLYWVTKLFECSQVITNVHIGTDRTRLTWRMPRNTGEDPVTDIKLINHKCSKLAQNMLSFYLANLNTPRYFSFAFYHYPCATAGGQVVPEGTCRVVFVYECRRT